MTLADLDAGFIRRVTDDGKTVQVNCTFKEAEGVRFLCPKCFHANGGPIGTHQIWCWRPVVPPEVTLNPGRWEFEGTGLDDLTLVAGSSSILLTSGCQWHGFVRNGQVTDA